MRKSFIIAMLLFLPLCMLAQDRNTQKWEVDAQFFIGRKGGLAHGYGGTVSFLPVNTGRIHWGATVGMRRISAPLGNYLGNEQMICDYFWCVPVMLKGEYRLGPVFSRTTTPFISLSAGYVFSSGIRESEDNAGRGYSNNLGFGFEPQIGLFFAKHFYASVGLWGQLARNAVFDVDAENVTYPHTPIRIISITPYYLIAAASFRIGVRF
ncbi:MAG: hypothetical protein K6A62_06615 [Bacteroidales bacterium]|nr:hypothetical protein [Bacteroidales bacterium]